MHLARHIPPTTQCTIHGRKRHRSPRPREPHCLPADLTAENLDRAGSPRRLRLDTNASGTRPSAALSFPHLAAAAHKECAQALRLLRGASAPARRVHSDRSGQWPLALDQSWAGAQSAVLAANFLLLASTRVRAGLHRARLPQPPRTQKRRAAHNTAARWSTSCGGLNPGPPAYRLQGTATGHTRPRLPNRLRKCTQEDVSTWKRRGTKGTPVGRRLMAGSGAVQLGAILAPNFRAYQTCPHQ